MRLRSVAMVLAASASVLATGCSASNGDSASSGPSQVPSDYYNVPTTAAKLPPAPAPKPRASNIVDNYDTATCADWRVTNKRNRQIVSTYFLVESKVPALQDQELTLETAITTACKGVAGTVTVARVAHLSIQTLKRVLGP